MSTEVRVDQTIPVPMRAGSRVLNPITTMWSPETNDGTLHAADGKSDSAGTSFPGVVLRQNPPMTHVDRTVMTVDCTDRAARTIAPSAEQSFSASEAADLAGLRIGAVRYLNSKPLLEDMHTLAAGARLTTDYPSLLADQLAAGELDVALIPSIEYLRGEGYEIVSDACVASRGPVRSVKLYSRVPIGEIRRLALDLGSRTSAALVQILLSEKYGVLPQLEPLALGDTISQTSADAVLLIGDRAMFEPSERFAVTWDLAEEWFRWTGLPFVFAMWVARPGRSSAALCAALQQARDRGESRAVEIARREGSLLGLPDETTIHYLTKNLHFRLGPAERSGLRWFADLAGRTGLAPRGVDLVFRG
jgi:chorismate dehydratase